MVLDRPEQPVLGQQGGTGGIGDRLLAYVLGTGDGHEHDERLGPRQHPEKFVPMAIRHLLDGEPVPVHGQLVEERWRTPTSSSLAKKWHAGSRFYTFVSNISDALRFLYERSVAMGTRMYPDVERPERFNLVGEREVRNDEMVSELADLLERPVSARLGRRPFGSPRPRSALCS